jgi:membrane protease subunit HflC
MDGFLSGHGHGHGHDHHGHGHGHSHAHGPADTSRLRVALRLVFATLIVVVALLATTATPVGAGEAMLVTRFGSPVRVVLEPGLSWKLPAPVEAATPVDLRLRTTTSGLQDVGTRDGLRILVQAYVAWQVPPDATAVRTYVRAIRNDPDEAARQLRSFIGSALQVTASSFTLADLVNTNGANLHLADLRARLLAELRRPLLANYGIAIRAAGVERLSLPDTTLAATVSRMRSERETVAAERTAEGLRQAAEIRSEAARDSRIEVAAATTEAARIEAAARAQAAAIQATAYKADPALYTELRSLDTLSNLIGPNARIVLRTDAAPFDLLVAPPK